MIEAAVEEVEVPVIPATFFRATSNCYMTDEQGFLVSHLAKREYEETFSLKDPENHRENILYDWMKMWLAPWREHDYSEVHLAHPDDWMSFALFMFPDFRLLTIDASQVEITNVSTHSMFTHNEYRGKVPKQAILSDEAYRWEKSDTPLDLPDCAIEGLKEKNLGDRVMYHPVKV